MTAAHILTISDDRSPTYATWSYLAAISTGAVAGGSCGEIRNMGRHALTSGVRFGTPVATGMCDGIWWRFFS